MDENDILDHKEPEGEVGLNYASLTDRLKALVADYLIIVFLAFLASKYFESAQPDSNTGRIIAFVLVFILYAPLFVAFTGGTVGHHLMKIKVKRKEDINKNIFFHLAIIRFVIKALLGWISVLTVSSNEYSQGLHDKAASSVVLRK